LHSSIHSVTFSYVLITATMSSRSAASVPPLVRRSAWLVKRSFGRKSGVGSTRQMRIRSVTTTDSGWLRSSTRSRSSATVFVVMIRAGPTSSNFARPSRASRSLITSESRPIASAAPRSSRSP
jgi:hypothetical protein